jgi:hypothetical protein
MNAQPSPQEIERRRRGVLLPEALEEAARGPAGRELDGGQRLQVLDTLIAALEGSYAHLAAKRAAYATDPVQALTLLRAARSNWAKASSIGR